ncbi:MAG: phosphatase PAP2 family protein [Afipia felis]|nr:phosphatase PAP2 family protein [Afipia felis]
MNKTGLVIALAVGAIVGIVFGVFPELDLKIAALFYDPTSHRFPMQASHVASFARDAAMWITWAFALPALVSLAVKIVLPRRRMLVSPRATLFLTLSIVLTAGIISNAGFKTYWGRPRPVATAEFGGPWQFKAWWNPTGQCPRNCSFYSGEATTAFWTYAPAALAPPQWRPLAYVAATVFGLVTGLLRMTFGGHYFTDVIFGGVMAFLIVWVMHGIYYRWPTRQSDDEIDARLTRWFLALVNAIGAPFKRRTPTPPEG